ncbi:energy-coupling factor transporter transmembrane component T family protein [Gulosibacter chungangensis]|uniref:Energy-coupling factor transporter transmembrane protein EcfT n=1 Tax=Gulosibacter chungangensis TaxID=979746 RepID=A0A7J5BBU0_9MICO|nr:energy-coupling factor transporter transmembrane component T [Gulosibacter chungangensis]KAB1642196.1 energy-coupling factor transporter transmembrane protein EcfT [Gulosibacter chungangensis]
MSEREPAEDYAPTRSLSTADAAMLAEQDSRRASLAAGKAGPLSRKRKPTLRDRRSGARLDRPTIAEADSLGLPFLHRIHPLAKLFAALIPMIGVFFVGGVWIPAGLALLSIVLLLIGSSLRWSVRLALVLGFPLLTLVLSITLGIWIEPSLVADTPALFSIGNWTFHQGAWLAGLETACRIVAIVALSMLSGSTTSGGDFVRALVQQLRVPYRFGYAGLAALRFVPRFRLELRIIKQAHRARGISFGRGPIGWLRRQLSSLVPLLAAALRHADRVALSMDARGFGFRETRTERHLLRVLPRDWAFLLLVLLLASAIFASGFALGLG